MSRHNRAACLAILLATALLASGCSRKPAESGTGYSDTPSHQPPPAPVLHYTQALKALDEDIAAYRRAAEKPNTGQPLQILASILVQRAQLTGDYADYLAVGDALDKAEALGGKTLVCLQRLKWNLSLHRIPVAQALLPGCKPPEFKGPDPEWLGLAAELDFQRGDYAAALTGYRRSLAVEESLIGLTRLSTYHARTGNLSEASALLDRCLALLGDPKPGGEQFRAWLYLQRGLQAQARGRLDQAMALYQLGRGQLAGWWLLDEHVAEVQALQGEVEAARKTYEAAIQSNPQPELMDGLALLLRDSAGPAAARPWVQKAEALHRERLKLSPEAAYGHALDHFLQFGEPAEALDLARRNAALRPNGESRIKLAEALFKAGQAKAALAEIDSVLTSGWNTAELHAIAAQLDAALGHSAEADAQRDAATELNREAMRMYRLVAPAAPDLAG